MGHFVNKNKLVAATSFDDPKKKELCASNLNSSFKDNDHFYCHKRLSSLLLSSLLLSVYDDNRKRPCTTTRTGTVLTTRTSTSTTVSVFRLLLLFLCFQTSCQAVKVTQPNELLKVLNSDRYNRFATPTSAMDQATNVTVGIYIEGMSSIRAQTMDFHVDIYFEQRWEDRRLRHNHTNRVLVKDLEIYDKMWHPDLYFANANRAKFFDVTAPNFLLWIFPNGTIHHEMRISLTVICNMLLRKYPLDKQECNLRLLSYAYTEEQLRMFWRKTDAITINPALRLPDMEIDRIRPETCDGTYALGTWSCLIGYIELKREIMHHVLQSYVPTMLIVIISWFSFWLDIDAVPGRVSLCITTLLTLATQASSARMALPQVSYAKAIDVWMEACLGFVFGVLIEFTGVNFLARRGQEEHQLSQADDMKLLMKDETNREPLRVSWDAMQIFSNNVDFKKRRNRVWRGTAIKIDKMCRLVFPLAFVFFNLIYWPYYLIFT